MISLTDYTTYAEVRAVLGVSVYELTDATLGLPIYTRGLQSRLYSATGTFGSVSGSLIDVFEALTADGETLTSDEENMLGLIKQFATFSVAEACLSGLSLLALKTETDGEAAQSRFSSEATYKDVGIAIRQNLASLLAQIDQLLGGQQTTAPKPLLSAIQPGTDVVTNESA